VAWTSTGDSKLTDFDPRPNPPPDLAEAAKSGELVVFIGAGISRLIGCPSWEEFADRALEQLVPSCINHYELAQIKSIGDAKKRLSIAKILAEKAGKKIDFIKLLGGRDSSDSIYSHLAKFRCSFVTTNYDKYVIPQVNATRDEVQWRFSRRDQLLGANLDRLGNVIHLHGCVDNPDLMVVSTRDYLEHYASKEVQEFLTYLFQRKTVLFLGYGLEEVEVLEYILRKGLAGPESRMRRYILQGFFNAELRLFEVLSDYYQDGFGAKLIGFPRDDANFAQQIEIVSSWAAALQFGALSFADEIAALEDEING
jgi:hypothetical protein